MITLACIGRIIWINQVIKDMEMAEPSMLGAVAESEFQYGADAFEAYQQSAKAETVVMPEVKTSEIKNKSR